MAKNRGFATTIEQTLRRGFSQAGMAKVCVFYHLSAETTARISATRMAKNCALAATFEQNVGWKSRRRLPPVYALTMAHPWWKARFALFHPTVCGNLCGATSVGNQRAATSARFPVRGDYPALRARGAGLSPLCKNSSGCPSEYSRSIFHTALTRCSRYRSVGAASQNERSAKN